LLWGVNFSVVKDALNVVDPLVFNGGRFLLAGAALAVLRPASLEIDRSDLIPLAGLGIVGHTAYQVGFIFGLDVTLAGNAAVILAAAPIWTLMFAVLVGQEAWRPALGAAAVLGLAGIGLVMAGGAGGLAISRDTVRGDLLMAGASVC
ncbi:MAG: DMT family transporter, partial [Gemmatimonadetes bacterium]|nr:DMT family transporter [Gemmatimonadota bacterium]